MIKYRFILNRFDGEGGPGGEASASAEGQAAAVEGERTVQAASAGKEETFESLIGKDGKYKADYDKAVQKIIDRRFGKAKANEEKLGKLDPIIATLASKYGVDANDIDGLASAVDSDNSLFEDKAFEKGLTVEQYRNIFKIERENAQLKAQQEAAQRDANMKMLHEKWDAEAEVVKQHYPGFDLRSEFENPTFRDLISRNIPMESAYVAVHSNEILQGAMAQTAQAVSKKTADSIAARGNRPMEGGIGSQAAAKVKTDVSTLSKSDRARLAERALRGERSITL